MSQKLSVTLLAIFGKIKKSHRLKAIVFFLALLFGASSCVPYKNVVYFQDENGDTYDAPALPEVYKVKEGDLLQVEIKTLTENTEDFILGGGSTTGNVGQSKTGNPQMLLRGFLVSEDGDIDLPLLGKQKVAGLSTDEISTTLEAKLQDYKKFSKVKVTLTNFSINVMGEVKSPGVQYIYDSKYSLFQALSNAGDLTDFGNRKRIKLIREESGKIKNINFDLTSPESLSSNYVYLKPGDMIYVEPVKAKITRSNTQNVSLGVSLASFMITVLALFAK